MTAAALLTIAAVVAVAAGRAQAASQFAPAQAVPYAGPVSSSVPATTPEPPIGGRRAAFVRQESSEITPPSPEVVSSFVSPTSLEEPSASPPPATPQVDRQPPPSPAVVISRSSATPSPTPTCPDGWFCYPRLGISGAIVPYTDCSGSTDVGTAIRSFPCLSDRYLMGHAFTQFGRITSWQAGDIVFAWGQRFTVAGAVTAESCAAPPLPLAPLSMQTSLSSNVCGPVLVVQAR